MKENEHIYVVIKEDNPPSKNKYDRLIVLISLIAVILICLSVYMHIRQEPHLGRLKYDDPSRRNSQKNYKQLDVIETELETGTTITSKVESIRASKKEENTFNFTSNCLHCICMTIRGCPESLEGCPMKDECSLSTLRMSKLYWSDGGELSPPFYEQNHPSYMNTTEAYSNCVIDEVCIENTVNNYMARFPRDCNGDGKIDCQDYIAIHILGPFGCQHRQLSQLQKHNAFQCIAEMLE